MTADDVWRFLAACRTCGEPHEYRPMGPCSHGINHGSTWASPVDGHSYRRRDLSTPEALAAARAEWEQEASDDE